MSSTIAELGIAFPLFGADVREANEYCGVAACSICGTRDFHCFKSSYLIATCLHCDAENALCDGKPGQCRACGQHMPFPSAVPLDRRCRVTACYACLRAGHVALPKDTPLGLVTFEDALGGLTGPAPEHALDQASAWLSDGNAIVGTVSPAPLLDPNGFERVFVSREPAVVGTEPMDWFRSRVPRDHLFELLHTPTYGTIQGENWQFHCGQPMVYIGTWTQYDFQQRVPDGEGRELFNEIVADSQWLPDVLCAGRGEVWGTYVFRCAVCGQLTAHWDVA